VTVLVEGFEPDQIALAAYLAAASPRGSVRLAGPGPVPDEAPALSATGVLIEPYTDLATDTRPADAAYLDVWTPEAAPHVERLRRQGARITSIGDVVLERAAGVTVGVTGTAGKTTATSIAAQLLRAGGVAVDASTTGRLGNLWPTADLLERQDPARPLLLELTSSHLAFMRASPRIAAITCFWPDHLELHGSLAAYRAAKETIVRGQRPGDTVVVNADDPQVAAFAELTPARLVEVSLERPVEHGCFVRCGTVVLRWDGVETPVGALDPVAFAGHRGIDLLVGVAVAAAVGLPAAAFDATLPDIELPPFRGRPVGLVAGVPVIDDGMAATPSKTAATLAAFPEGGVVLIAGGIDDLGAGPVHATPPERALLERACDVVARCARLVVLFGPAATRLEPLLVARNVPCIVAGALDGAVDAAVTSLGQDEALVFSPMFPAGIPDRERFAFLVNRRQAGAGPEEN
jgi:UDP-N-acetylmuramoylalanine--D-glutamate ligase